MQAAADSNEEVEKEKADVLRSNEVLADEIKELELQIDDLQESLRGRDKSIDTLKARIESLEQQLLTSQDQIANVMKLNAEVGLASQHWEKSFLEVKHASDNESARIRSELENKLESE